MSVYISINKQQTPLLEVIKMTELQLKIRRLAHRVSALKKGGKDAAAVVAELAQLRAQRKEEHAAEKASKAPAKKEG